MEKIAIISDVHANITALKAVLEDIEKRKVNKIFCLGDSIVKGASPDKVIDILKEKCEIILIGNTDYSVCNPNVKSKNYWTRRKIGEERAEYISKLPVMYEFYLSGQLIRLFHATPYNLDGIYNPMFSNTRNSYKNREILKPEKMFENTEFLGKSKNDKIPDIVGYGHIHTPLIVKYKNKTIFNTGSVGIPTEMLNLDETDETNKFSTVASYMILEGEFESKEYSDISFTQVRVKYNIEEEIENIINSDMPNKNNIIKSLKTAISEQYMHGGYE